MINYQLERELRAAEEDAVLRFLQANITKPIKTKDMAKLLQEKQPDGITAAYWRKNIICSLLLKEGYRYGIVPIHLNGFRWITSERKKDWEKQGTIREHRERITERRHKNIDLLLQTLEKQEVAMTLRELWAITFPDKAPSSKNLASLGKLFAEKCKWYLLEDRVNLNVKLYYIYDEQKEKRETHSLRAMYDLRHYEYYAMQRLKNRSKNPVVLEWCEQHKEIPYDVEEILQYRKERKELRKLARQLDKMEIVNYLTISKLALAAQRRKDET